MKFLLVLIAGLVVGAFGATGFLYVNPFTSQAVLSPLTVSDQRQIGLNYSVVAEDSILFTNNGESQVQPFPDKVQQLWEPTVSLTETRVTVLKDSRGRSVGLGIKYASQSENTRLLNGEVLVDSVWYIYMPSQGSMLVGQTENHWRFMREIVMPARWSSGDNWRGRWHGTLTSGPGALGTARVYGGAGDFENLESEAVETLSARAYSTEIGPVAIDGQLLIEIPDPKNTLAVETGGE